MKTRPVTFEYAIPNLEAGGAVPVEILMDEETFTGFYQRTARPLWAYLARVSGDPALAEDLVQESYLRFLSAGKPQYGDVACRRYLFCIATNLLRDHWRRPVTKALEELPEEECGVAEPSATQVESQAMLDAGLERMKPRERQLLWLAYAEGCTHREIAEITGLRSPSIRLLLFRARRKLARFLRQHSPITGKNL